MPATAFQCSTAAAAPAWAPALTAWEGGGVHASAKSGGQLGSKGGSSGALCS